MKANKLKFELNCPRVYIGILHPIKAQFEPQKYPILSLLINQYSLTEKKVIDKFGKLI